MGAHTTAGWVAALVAAAAISMLSPHSAQGHGRFPATGQIVFHPTDPDTIVVRTTFGILVTRDAGNEWRWICLEVTGARETEDPTLAVTPDSSITAALFDGLARGTELGCGWGFPSPALEGVVVIDQASHPTAPGSLFAVTSSGGQDNLVYRSDDEGTTWTPTGEPIEPILFEGIEIAPSDPERIYLSGSYPPTGTDPRLPYVHRSSDGGASWTRMAFDGFGPTDQNVIVLGVDPSDPDHLFLRVKNEESDRLMRSTDGGQTWAEALSMPILRGFAWSEDGSTVWAGGGERSGLWRSDDGGATFTQIGEQEIRCLAARGDELWACANNFADGYAIGRSTDGGESFEPVLSFEDVAGMVECGADSQTTRECAPLLPDLMNDLGLDVGDGGTGSADAGPGEGGEPKGCGCVTAGSGPGDGPGAWLVLLTAALAIGRRARRHALS